MTAGTALSILSVLLSLVKWWTEWISKRRLIEQGHKDAVLEGLQASQAAIALAVAAREQVRGELARDPNSLRKPDEFERKD